MGKSIFTKIKNKLLGRKAFGHTDKPNETETEKKVEWKPIEELRVTDGNYSGMGYSEEYANLNKDMSDYWHHSCYNEVGIKEIICLGRNKNNEIKYCINAEKPWHNFYTETQFGEFNSYNQGEFGGYLILSNDFICENPYELIEEYRFPTYDWSLNQIIIEFLKLIFLEIPKTLFCSSIRFKIDSIMFRIGQFRKKLYSYRKNQKAKINHKYKPTREELDEIIVHGNFTFVFDAGKKVYAVSSLAHFFSKQSTIYRFHNKRYREIIYKSGAMLEDFDEVVFDEKEIKEYLDEINNNDKNIKYDEEYAKNHLIWNYIPHEYMTCDAVDVKDDKAYFLLTGTRTYQKDYHSPEERWDVFKILEATDTEIKVIYENKTFYPYLTRNLIVEDDFIYISCDKNVLKINRETKEITYLTCISPEDEANLKATKIMKEKKLREEKEAEEREEEEEEIEESEEDN